MLPRTNRQVVLKSRPSGIPQAQHFELLSTALPELLPGEVLVRNEFLSVDPAMRGWVNAAANYSDPVGIGEVMRSFAAGQVMASRHAGYTEGDRVMGMLGWQEYAVTDGKQIRRKIVEPDLPLSLSLGVLGLNGVTAYFALTEVGEPRPEDTVVVSAAAGAVGSAVGQIAKIAGCRTVGIAGGEQKVRLCVDVFATKMQSITSMRTSSTSSRRYARPASMSISTTPLDAFLTSCCATLPKGRAS